MVKFCCSIGGPLRSAGIMEEDGVHTWKITQKTYMFEWKHHILKTKLWKEKQLLLPWMDGKGKAAWSIIQPASLKSA